MSKPNLLIVCPPEHYVLRNFESLRDTANVCIGAELAKVEQQARTADVILYTGLTGRSVR
ncbi:MAG: hypothetical protein JO217_06125, partial [Acidobacteriaceae bacterium]|nr:hypothetical protein [Acidobacteriaceae bacterium]